MRAKFMICRHCHNLIGVIQDAKVPVRCCGEDMEELVPNTVEASGEKHIPTVSVEGNVVSVHVGSVAHPMQDVHYIEWIALETERGMQRKNLQPGEVPAASFAVTEDDKPLAVYAYCNLHGLWKTEL